MINRIQSLNFKNIYHSSYISNSNFPNNVNFTHLPINYYISEKYKLKFLLFHYFGNFFTLFAYICFAPNNRI